MSTSRLTDRLQTLVNQLPKHVQLVAVSKFHPIEQIMEAYRAGQRRFGESRVQELCSKVAQLPSDIEWHFIGHLQTNKIKQISRFVALIEGVDSLRLLQAINKEGERINRKIPCLLQVYIAKEDTKYGFLPEECRSLFESASIDSFPYIQFKGLMGMATYTEDRVQIKAEFGQLKALYDEIRQKHAAFVPDFSVCSMGMSSDYDLAIEAGSTLIRVGTAIFGNRSN